MALTPHNIKHSTAELTEQVVYFIIQRLFYPFLITII
jgi:hypothetical protein